MPPQVRDIQALIAQQQASLDPQYKLIDESINANDQSGQAQVQGLDAAKTKAFGGIEQAASDKGMFFSGFSPNEQANYTASTYLPALAQLQGTIASARNQLLGKKADLGKSAFDTATQMQEQDRAVLNDWNAKTRDQQFQASEAEKQRAFEANQNEQNRRADAAKSASNNAAAKPSTAQFLGQAFSGYKPAYEGGQAYYTEREVIPALMANYGLDQKAAASMAYDYRKRVFGEGSGK